MGHRHAILDDDWARIKDLLPGQPGQHGKFAKDNRLFVDAVLWVVRTGAPWSDLPDRFGVAGVAVHGLDCVLKAG